MGGETSNEPVTPSPKAPAIDNFLTCLSPTGMGRIEAINKSLCVWCGGEAKEFEDELSRKEYGISGMCQKCQKMS